MTMDHIFYWPANIFITMAEGWYLQLLVQCQCLLWWQDHPQEKSADTWCPTQPNTLHCERQLETIFQSSPHLLLPPSTFHHHTEEASDECNQSCGKLKLLTIFCNKSKVSAKFKHCKSYCSYMLTLSFFMIDIKYKIQIDSRLIWDYKISCL